MNEVLNDLKEGVVIKGPFWPEEIKIYIAKIIGNRIQIIGAGLKTEKSYQNIYNIEDLQNKIEIVSGLKGPKFSANANKFRLALEAKRIRMSYEFDPLFAVGVSKIDPLPHQIEAVYDYLLKRPKIRFLLADDPGAGKTIMAGLLLKELKYRRVIERVLIVTPPALVDNWKEELFEKFGEVFTEINRESMNSSYGTNVWEQSNQFIVSIDFAKQEDVLDVLRETHWDIVIVDEAHKLSAYRFGQKTEKSQRFKLGEVLSEITEHLLFLTATPHKGDPENFLLLLSLLDKNLYSNTDLLREAIQKNENPIMLRRLKEHMIDENGKRLFPERKVHTKPYDLTAQEKGLYDAVTEYVTKNFEKALGDKRKNSIGFALIVLQRRLASSIRAIRKSLERRRDKLKDHFINWDNYVKQISEERDLSIEDIEDLEEAPEKERWEEEEKLMSLTTAQTKDELEFEIKELERLCELAIQIERSGMEKKLDQLKNVLLEVEEIRNTNEKLLVFTEYKDTADYLAEKVQQWGFSITCINGSLDMDQRKKAMIEFNFGDKQIMIATEAAGEGINLQQKCALMINYDIPWNPTRLEQRMGRIHRYGQKKEVHIYNLIAINTREGRVLQVILDKLEQMRHHLGSDKVYDVIDKLLEEENVRLDQLIKESIRNRVAFEDFCKRWQKPLTDEDLQKLRIATEEALATRHVDLSRYQEKMQTAEEQRLIPEYIEQFFVDAFKDVGGGITSLDKNIWRIDQVPMDVRRALAKTSQIIKRYYGKISFNKKIVKESSDKGLECEYIAPGSMLFESVCELILEKYSHTLQEGAIFLDPEGTEEGLMWFVIGKITDGKGRKIGERLFVVMQKKSGEIIKKGPFALWDLNPSDTKIEFSLSSDTQIEKENVISWILDKMIDPFFAEIKEQRMRELDIRKKYVEKSMNYLLSESIKRLGKHRENQNRGKDMGIAITQEVQKQEELHHRKKKAIEEIDQEKNLSPSMPEVIAIIGISPLKTDDKELYDVMKRDDEIERIAMETAVKFEEKESRRPEDVSSENLGYDIKSKKEKELRYIEVKGRSRVAKIALTPNEWIKANRFKENYWLYVVANCATKPELYLIQDPASKLKPNQVVEITRYLIDADQWKKVGERAG